MSLHLTAPMENKTVTRKVIERIQSALLEGELRPGDKLPTEDELCRIWGVSRTPVREAVKVLEFMGILEIRRAEGTFVATRVGPSVLNPLALKLLFAYESAEQFIEFRREVERMVLRLAIEKADESDLAAISENVAAMEQADAAGVSPDEFMALEAEFHRMLADATRNPLIGALATEVFEAFATSVRRSHAAGGRQVALAHHRRLLLALKTRDLAAADEALADALRAWSEFIRPSPAPG